MKKLFYISLFAALCCSSLHAQGTRALVANSTTGSVAWPTANLTLTCNFTTTKNVTASNLTATNLVISGNASAAEMAVTNATFGNLTVSNNFTVSNFSITDLTAGNFTGNLVTSDILSGNTVSTTNLTATNASATNLTISGVAELDSLHLAGSLLFEGSTANAFDTTLSVEDPTGNRTITLPDGNTVFVPGNYTIAATGNATGLTSGEVADSLLSANVTKTVSGNASVTGNLSVSDTLTVSGHKISILSGDITYDCPSIAAGGNTTTLIPVTNATTSGVSAVIVTPSDEEGYLGLQLRGKITSTGNATVYIYNGNSAGSIDPTTATLTVTVIYNQ